MDLATPYFETKKQIREIMEANSHDIAPDFQAALEAHKNLLDLMNKQNDDFETWRLTHEIAAKAYGDKLPKTIGDCAPTAQSQILPAPSTPGGRALTQ